MSSEYAEYRVERNLRLEERARQDAWQEAGALQERQRRLNERIAQAEREYGSDLMGGRKRAPREPGRSSERRELERYVKDLRRYCVTGEKRIEEAVAGAKRLLDEAWGEAYAIEKLASDLGRRAEAARERGPIAIPTQRPRRPAESAQIGEIQTYVTAMKKHCDVVEAAIGQANVASERNALLDEIGSHASEDGSADDLFPVRQRSDGAIDAGATSGASSRGGDGAAKREAARQETVRILGGLSEAVSSNERDALKRIAASVAEARAREEHGRAKTLLVELRVGVQQANGSAARRSDEAARCAGRVAALKEKLWGLEGSDVREIVDEIARMEREEAPLTDEVAARAEQVSRAARERADRAYAAEVMQEELQRLGYEVGESFESLFVAGGEKLVRKPRAGDYGVLVEVDGTSVHVEPVRIGQPLAGSAEAPGWAQPQDLEAGRACCEDFRTMRAAMKERGVVNKVARIDPVGSEPLRMVPDEQVGSGQQHGTVDTGRRRRPVQRQRSRS